MKSFSFAALAAALVSLSAVPAYAGVDPNSGECGNAKFTYSMYKGAGEKVPPKVLEMVKKCTDAKKQQVSQQAAQPKKVGLGWMFR